VYENFAPKRELATEEKMEMATQLVAEYMTLVKELLTFGRDRDAPNFQHPVEEFYRLLAHLALEDCYLENDARILDWKRGDEAGVPSPERIRYYANEHEVEDLEEKFLKAACELVKRDRFGEYGVEPVHLAFDITDVPWYGAEDHHWTSSGKKRVNTTNYWKYAVLSIANTRRGTPQRNYILGITPIKDGTEDTDALRRLLRRAANHSGLEFGRVYCDSGFYQGDAVKACRDVGANYIIQAHNKGAPGELIEETPPGEHDKDTDINFAGLNGIRQFIRSSRRSTRQRSVRANVIKPIQRGSPTSMLKSATSKDSPTSSATAGRSRRRYDNSNTIFRDDASLRTATFERSMPALPNCSSTSEWRYVMNCTHASRTNATTRSRVSKHSTRSGTLTTTPSMNTHKLCELPLPTRRRWRPLEAGASWFNDVVRLAESDSPPDVVWRTRFAGTTVVPAGSAVSTGVPSE